MQQNSEALSETYFCSFSTRTNLAITKKRITAIGAMSKKVVRHPKSSTMIPPIIKPITAPPDSVELNIP